jgi:ribose transport system permease protein
MSVAAAPSESPAVDRRRLASGVAVEFGIVWVLLVLVVVSAILYPGVLDVGNLRNVLSQNAPIGIVAAGMTFVMIAGGFDLSVGAIVALVAVVYAKLAGTMPLAPAALLALLAGTGVGVFNGLVVTRLRVNPFVATLGSGSIVGGLAFLLSQSQSITVERPSFMTLGNEAWLGVPIAVWLLILVIAVAGVLLQRTAFGASVYAVGGNTEASRLAGIAVGRVRVTTYAISGLLAALAGLLLVSRLATAQADMGGTVALDAIAIVVIGGTSLLGGEGAIWRTAVGLLVLAVLNNLFNSLALDTNWQAVIKGTIVIAAVAVDALVRHRST